MTNDWKDADWWEGIEDFDLRGLTRAVLEIKRERTDELTLSPRAYDFVIYLGNVI